ncbi:MAG: cupin domain-containing protein [Betaproteobacteria bacterium]
MRKLQGDTDPLERCHITLQEAAALLPTPDGKRSVALFEHGTLQVKLYAPRGSDPQTPHTRDEIYVIARGAGWFVNGPSRHRFAVHDVLFVPAGVVHRFEEFSDDFHAWVFFYGPEGGEPAGA